MASQNIAFDNIPASIRKPGKYFELNTKLAVRTLATNEQRVLIIAQKLPESAAPLEPVQIFDDATAAALFGYGSQAHAMVKAAITAYPYIDLTVLPVPPHAAGIAASGKVTLSGQATSAGVLKLSIGNSYVAVAASYQDAATDTLAALAAAINGEQDLPVTAAITTAEGGTPTMTVTAKNKGTLGNRVALALSSTVAGYTASKTDMSGGQQDPDLADALAVVFASNYNIYCVPWAAAEPLTALREHLEAISGPLEQRRATGWTGTTGSLASATTLAGQLNSGRISLACLPGTTSLPEELAAAYAAVAASEEDPARPLNTLALSGIAAPPVAARLGRNEQEVMLKNGATPLEVGPGETVQIVRAVSTYTRNAVGATDISMLDMTTIRTLDYTCKAVKERVDLRFPREKLSTRTPAKVRSEVLDVLRGLGDLEILEEVEANAEGVIAERDLQDPNRLNIKIPADVVNGLHVLAARVDLLL